MIYFILLLISITGYTIVSSIKAKLNLVLKAGLSILMGLGLQSLLIIIFDLVHIPITLISLCIGSILISIGLSLKFFNVYKDDFKRVKSFQIGFGQVNFSWIFFLGIILYIIYGLYKKGAYWPVTEFDSVTGYDFMGKMIAKEQVLKISLFDFSTSIFQVSRFLYPPLVASGMALEHMCGDLTPRIVPVAYYVAMLFGFYGSVRYFTTHTAAIISTAFLAVTPELCSHAALSLTNLPNAAYVSLSLFTFCFYFSTKEDSWLYLSAAVMAFTLFSRSDSIVFSATACGTLLIQAIKTKNYKQFVVYSLIANSLFFTWAFYTKFILNSTAADFFEKTLFWDEEKIGRILTYVGDFILWDTQLFGLSFWLFFLILALNYKNIRTDITLFLAVSIISWFLYTFIYYQMSYKYGTLDIFMRAGYKRGLFCFVPLAWFYIICNRNSVWMFKKIDEFLYK